MDRRKIFPVRQRGHLWCRISFTVTFTRPFIAAHAYPTKFGFGSVLRLRCRITAAEQELGVNEYG